jgi:geranylgeranyl pyrophosphate synthase
VTSFNARESTAQLLEQIDRYLFASIPADPLSLYAPVRSTLQASGKRVRPLLTALVSRLTADNEAWLPAAIAVELLHTFTLLHDDIMDNAETRRGKPTVHVTHGVNTAILSGDVIIALATEALAKADAHGPLLAEFAIGFKAVCEGQALDKEFETRDDITVDEYLAMIDLKTAKVIELAAVLGDIMGGGQYIEQSRRFAHHLGLAFQIRDDVLDLTANQASFGKTIGGDILEGKRTILFALAAPQGSSFSSEEKNLFDRIKARATIKDDIALARTMFERIGALASAAKLAEEQTQKAKAELEALPPSQARQQLSDFADWLLGRLS